jgi:hypothetical protein
MNIGRELKPACHSQFRQGGLRVLVLIFDKKLILNSKSP